MHQPSDVPPVAPPVTTPARLGVKPGQFPEWPANASCPYYYGLCESYSTIQGEGAHAGTAAVFIRLQGCPVGCVFCDTGHSWPKPEAWVSTYKIVDPFLDLARPRIAVVTGGEPCIYNLAELARVLRNHGFLPHLETSGAFRITGGWDWICISPKPMGLVPLYLPNLSLANEIKWLVGKQEDLDRLTEFRKRNNDLLLSQVRISVQPISTSKEATRLCIEAVYRDPSVHLSIQTHKLLGIA